MDLKYIEKLNIKWNELVANSFLSEEDNTIWKFNRSADIRDPEEGWKLHISATILNACDILTNIFPFLSKINVLFKVPISLYELQKLNSGLFYGFSQIGKFITIYPKNEKEALLIANKLYMLTYQFDSPKVPFDKPFKNSKCIYYRYGSFSLITQNKDGSIISAIHDHSGNLIQDKRTPGTAVPIWLNDPFINNHINTTINKISFDNNIRAYEAISQRGKGGVYLAIDFSILPAKKCILKEGRKNGETEWDGRDGYWRIKHEANVLKELVLQGEVHVAKLYSTFEIDNNIYILMEYIEGVNFNSILKKKLDQKDYLKYGMQVARIMKSIHTAGWLWRDCKPTNLILSINGLLRPIDFEGACRKDAFEESPWGTPGFYTDEKSGTTSSIISQDLYALGATLHHIISGRAPFSTKLMSIEKFRRDVPESIRKIITELTNRNQCERPSAESVYQTFNLEYQKLCD